MDMAGGIMGEVKRHPYTSVTAFACLLAIPAMWTMKADAGDVNAIKAQIAEVRKTVQRESASTELNNVRRELFDISLRINTLERENVNVDRLLYERRDTLQSQQRLLESRLQKMDDGSP